MPSERAGEAETAAERQDMQPGRAGGKPNLDVEDIDLLVEQLQDDHPAEDDVAVTAPEEAIFDEWEDDPFGFGGSLDLDSR